MCVCLYLRLARPEKKNHLPAMAAPHRTFIFSLKLLRTINVSCCWLAVTVRVHVCVVCVCAQ